MFSRRSLIAVALAGSALSGGTSLAQPDQASVGIQTTTRYSLEGRIAGVDTNARTISITSADGTQRMLGVSPLAANIGSTRVGDHVVLGVEDTRTFVLSSPGVQTPAAGGGSVAAAVESSKGVTGARLSNSLANWLVVGVQAAERVGGELLHDRAGRHRMPGAVTGYVCARCRVHGRASRRPFATKASHPIHGDPAAHRQGIPRLGVASHV